MSVRVRPLTEEDLSRAGEIDAAYVASHDLEPAVSAASLRFFARTGHSFAAEAAGEGGSGAVIGFVLAQAVWSGDLPWVHVTRVACLEPQDAEAVAGALVKALVKSAYDAGVYDVHAAVPRSDGALQERLLAETFYEDPLASFVRVLGSRGERFRERIEANRGE